MLATIGGFTHMTKDKDDDAARTDTRPLSETEEVLREKGGDAPDTSDGGEQGDESGEGGGILGPPR
jgi:hypothetical protein